MKRATRNKKDVIKENIDEEKKPLPKITPKVKTKAKPKINKPSPGVLRWKKITNGSHSYKGTTIRKGDILKCYPNELSDIVKCHFKCLDDIPEESDDGVVLRVKDNGDGKFNVINSKTNESINETPLTKIEAEKIIDESIGD